MYRIVKNGPDIRYIPTYHTLNLSLLHGLVELLFVDEFQVEALLRCVQDKFFSNKFGCFLRFLSICSLIRFFLGLLLAGLGCVGSLCRIVFLPTEKFGEGGSYFGESALLLWSFLDGDIFLHNHLHIPQVQQTGCIQDKVGLDAFEFSFISSDMPWEGGTHIVDVGGHESSTGTAELVLHLNAWHGVWQVSVADPEVEVICVLIESHHFLLGEGVTHCKERSFYHFRGRWTVLQLHTAVELHLYWVQVGFFDVESFDLESLPHVCCPIDCSEGPCLIGIDVTAQFSLPQCLGGNIYYIIWWD